jgi:nucleoside-diphosphate-sugar epimerase
MRRRVPDTTKIHNLIGYAPKCDLDEILTSVIEYQRHHWAREDRRPVLPRTSVTAAS